MTQKPGPRTLIDQAERVHGAGALQQIGMTNNDQRNAKRLTTSLDALETAMGGGYPCGRIVEIYARPGAMPCARALALHAIRDMQAYHPDSQVAYVDVAQEHDVHLAAAIGVQHECLLFAQPDSGDQALAIVEQLVRSGGVALVVVDDVGSLLPQHVISGDHDESSGFQARLMSQSLQKITAVAHKTGATVIFLNELQDRPRLGAHQLNPGGTALKFYASLRLEVRHAPPVAVDQTGLVVVRVVKNKLAPPFGEATLVRSENGVLR